MSPRFADLSVSGVLGALRVWTRVDGPGGARDARAPGPPPGGGAGTAPDVRSDAPVRPSTGSGESVDTATGGAGAPPADALDVVLERARRCGYGAATTDALATAWSHLAPTVRSVVVDPLAPRARGGASDLPNAGRDGGLGPLTWAGVPARQVDPTTCGSAVLASLAAAGDPVLALWLETGRRVGQTAPPEVATAADRGPDLGADRFGAVQRTIKRASTRGFPPWPGAFGTPPWGAARVARFGDVRFDHRVVDVSRPGQVADVREAVERALRRGVPVPMYTGGALSTGLATAMPRHVVLITRTTSRAWHVYEPSRGEVLELDPRTLGEPGRRAAYGGWTRPAWVLLPRAGGRPAPG